MKKSFVMLVVLLTLAGCEKKTTEVSSEYEIPNGLKDCSIYEMNSENGKRFYVTRCPFSATSTDSPSGKTRVTSFAIEAPEEMKKKKALEKLTEEEKKLLGVE